MPEPTLAFIDTKLDRVLSEIRDLRSDNRFIREELRVLAAGFARLEAYRQPWRNEHANENHA